MLNRNTKLLISIVCIGALMITIIVMLVLAYSDNNSAKRDAGPNGLKIFDTLIKEAYNAVPLQDSLYNTLPSLNTNTLLFVREDSLIIDDDHLDLLMDFMQSGGEVFISASRISQLLSDRIFHIDDFMEQINRNLVFTEQIGLQNASYINGFTTTFLKDKNKEYVYNKLKGEIPEQQQYIFSPIYFQYKYIDLVYPIIPISNITVDYSINDIDFTNTVFSNADNNFDLDDEFPFENFTPNTETTLLVNYAKIQIGEGALFLHFNPELFTNYFLIREYGFDYLNKVFSYTKAKQILVAKNRHFSSRNNVEEKAPTIPRMQYIYNQPMLRNAWYVLLFAALLFILFRGKRKQRIVPIMAGPQNRSKEFIRNISYLYYKTQNHNSIAEKLAQNFIIDLNTKYGLQLKINRVIEQEDISKIAQKSNMDIPTLSLIISNYNGLKNQTKTAKQLHQLYDCIQSFYTAEAKAKELVSVS